MKHIQTTNICKIYHEKLKFVLCLRLISCSEAKWFFVLDLTPLEGQLMELKNRSKTASQKIKI
jgi:hypothetical protein